ncbi:MAG: hypothetical protein RL885_29565 [Planctomycetota bacterium]
MTFVLLFRTAALALSLLSSSALALQDLPPPPELSSKDERALDKAIRAYVKAKPEERDALFLELFTFGRAGVAYLEERAATRQELVGAVSQVTSQAPDILGLDLLEQEAPPSPRWNPTPIEADEIVLLRKDDRVVGFSIQRTGGESESLHISWWSQPDSSKKLTDPGGASGEVDVPGTPASEKLLRHVVWTEREYPLELEGLGVTLHSIGPTRFLHDFPGEVQIAASGETEPKKVTAQEVHGQAAYPSALGRLTARLEDYVYRTVPGCERLALEGAEQELFAEYEMVQVLVRQSKPTGEALVVVQFLEPQKVRLGSLEVALLRNFVRELAPLPDDRILFMGGQAPCPESNRFWIDGRWEKAKGKVAELLRADFSEGC